METAVSSACSLLEIACDITENQPGVAIIAVEDCHCMFHSDDGVRIALSALEICGLGSAIHTVERKGKIVEIHLAIGTELL